MGEYYEVLRQRDYPLCILHGGAWA